MRYSVIIGFRDWGLDRLTYALQHLVDQCRATGGEVIVSDYGSADQLENEASITATGARYVYTTRTGPWSRSRALNAGIAQATGTILIATDADMLFTPEAMPRIVDIVERNPSTFAVLQCRDLPPKFDVIGLRERQPDWDTLDMYATLRPRYGMGGMIAFRREAYLAVRGFDERMEIYGGEDIDFAQRLRRSGLTLHWIDDPLVRMYHIWHPSSRRSAEADKDTRQAVAINSRILTEDESFVRNVVEWSFRPDDAPPIASVVICTHDRREYLEEAVYSVLNQTVRDLELIIVDDGSTDGTWEFISSIDDPRVRPFRQESLGIAAARNLAAQQSRSQYTIIFDDDDIMLPTRVEDHFKALQGGDAGTYGGWIDFDNSDPKNFKINKGRDFSPTKVRVMGGVYLHPTLMLRTDLILKHAYNTTYRSGSDYNLAVRIIRSGYRLRHTGTISILRRLHERQVTHADASFQQSSWLVTQALGMFNTSLPQRKYLRKSEGESFTDLSLDEADAIQLLQDFGPAHFSTRSFIVRGLIPSDFQLAGVNTEQFAILVQPNSDNMRFFSGRIDGLTLRDEWQLRTLGLDLHRIRSSEASLVVTPLDDCLTYLASSRLKTTNDECLRAVAKRSGRGGATIISDQGELSVSIDSDNSREALAQRNDLDDDVVAAVLAARS